MVATAYPLDWPIAFPRSKSREAGRFKTSLSSALNNVETSLRGFARDSNKALTNVVLSSNVTLGAQTPSDPGVAAWFTWDGLQVCIPVDRYQTVEANLQAIHHVIEARRVELRHGTLALVRASMTGFKALPSPPGSEHWTKVFGVEAGQVVTKADVNTLFRRLAEAAHPDKPGGSDAAMSRLNAARDQALKDLA